MPSERLLLFQKCEKAMNNNSIRHAVGLFWVPEHAGVRGNEIADDGGSVLGLFEPQPVLGVYRRDI